MRTKIKRLLRRHRDKLPLPAPALPNDSGGEPIDRLNYLADMILDQAKVLYRYWLEVEGRLFDEF